MIGRSELVKANKYWIEQKARVERIASENGIKVTFKEHDDEYLYDLLSGGDLVLTDQDILKELRADFE